MSEEVGSVTEEAPESVQEEEETPTPTEEAEASPEDEDGSQETEDAEPEEETEDTEEPKKQTAQDRIRELAEEKNKLADKVAALESKVQTAIEAKDDIPAVDEQALNNHLGQMREQIDDLRLDGNHLQADMLERKRNKLLDEYEGWQKQQEDRKAHTTEQQGWEKSVKDVETTAEVYRDHYKIPEPLWKEMGEWFRDELKADSLLDQEFADVVRRQGPVAAVRFAHERAKPVFEEKARKAKEENAKRETGKTKQVGGAGAKEASGPKTYQSLMNLGSKQVEAFKEKNPQQYKKLFDAHMKK